LLYPTISSSSTSPESMYSWHDPVRHGARLVQRDQDLAFAACPRTMTTACTVSTDLNGGQRFGGQPSQVAAGHDAFLLGADIEDDLVAVLAQNAALDQLTSLIVAPACNPTQT